jgi:hypothetical protein
MKSFVASAGKLILLLSLMGLPARATEPEYVPPLMQEVDWVKVGYVSAATLAGTIAVAQLRHREVIFASLYGAGSIFYSMEVLDGPDTRFEDYVVPISLTTLGIANLTLLRDEDESKSTAAAVNFIGLSLIGLYWYHFERKPIRFGVTPNSVHFAFEF